MDPYDAPDYRLLHGGFPGAMILPSPEYSDSRPDASRWVEPPPSPRIPTPDPENTVSGSPAFSLVPSEPGGSPVGGVPESPLRSISEVSSKNSVRSANNKDESEQWESNGFSDVELAEKSEKSEKRSEEASSKLEDLGDLGEFERLSLQDS
ncbi:hypothetical protein BBP40_002002 [Aspergillus hancockii]|nr:hypothetical protein BBP40_002002 [Aspergillus hancockii]